MSDRKKQPTPDFSDVDWDAALDEWEKFALSDPPPKPDAPKAASEPPKLSPPKSRSTSNAPTAIIATDSLPPIPPAKAPHLELEDESTKVYDRDAVEQAAETAIRPQSATNLTVETAREHAPHAFDDEDTGVLAAPLEVTLDDIEDASDSTAGAFEYWDDERAASGWLDEPALADALERAAWFEEEARSAKDSTERARLLLAASELLAIAGDGDKARSIADEAKGADTSVLLARIQARQLSTREPLSMAALLDEEAALSDIPTVALHAQLFSAELHRLSGDGEGARTRWRAAASLDRTDVRAPLSLVGLALAFGDYLTPDLTMPEGAAFAPLSRALATVLTLRGAGSAALERDAGSAFINDSLSRTRNALAHSDTLGAARAVAPLGRVHGLNIAAAWLASALAATKSDGREESIGWLQPIAAGGVVEAQRAMAARGMEVLGRGTVSDALKFADAFEPAEVAALQALTGGDAANALEGLAAHEDFAPLRYALFACRASTSDDEKLKRAHALAGSLRERSLVSLGRLLAMQASPAQLNEAYKELPEDDRNAHPGIRFWLETRAGRHEQLASAWREWVAPVPGQLASRELALALACERCELREEALTAYGTAIYEYPGEDTLRRIFAQLGGTPLAESLIEAAEALPGGLRSAFLKFEAIERAELPPVEVERLLSVIAEQTPMLGLGAWLGEESARKRGDDQSRLVWLRQRRTQSTDPIERALDAVREARLLPADDRDGRRALLADALATRPDDVSLREKLELVSDTHDDHAEWCEKRAERAPGQSRAVLLLQASYAYALLGKNDDAARAARLLNQETDELIGTIVHERTALNSGESARLAEAWMLEAKGTSDPQRQKELYARLADLDFERGDLASSLLWHRTLLEENPNELLSLLSIEEALLKDGRDDELLPTFVAIARTLESSGGPEMFAHAEIAARISSNLDSRDTAPMVALASGHGHAPLWAVRAKHALARESKNDDALRESLLTLLSRSTKSGDKIALLLRLLEVCERGGMHAEAKTFLERAQADSPDDYVATLRLAELRERTKDVRGAAEAYERLAELSLHRDNKLVVCEKAAQLWEIVGGESARVTVLLETAARLAPESADLADRLLAIHRVTGAHSDLVAVIDRHLPTVTDPARRTALEIDRAMTQSLMGKSAEARATISALLEREPDHLPALRALAVVAESANDWEAAEQAYVRLGVLHASAEDQSLAYARLADIYAIHLNNLPRAEVALQEVIKRSPQDHRTVAKLIDVYRQQGAGPKALALQERLVASATTPAERVGHLIALAEIYETLIGDLRKAEHAYETARKEAPHSVAPLRALAEFYLRHRQMPAVHILLDRAAADARRGIAAGQLDDNLFDVLAQTWELRGRSDAAAAVLATKHALVGAPSSLAGAQVRAGSPEFDDYVAPELFTPALRSLLAHTGAAMDAALPADLKGLQAIPLPKGPLLSMIASIGNMMGMPNIQAFLSPQLGMRAIPLGSFPPSVAVGEGLAAAASFPACPFVIMRAMKMVHARASALIRCSPEEAHVLVLAWLSMFVRDFTPEGVALEAFRDMQRKITPMIAKNLDPTLGVAALEVSAALKEHAAHIGPVAQQWANRVGLFAVGDPSVALEGVAWSLGEKSAPLGAERAPWVARTIAARDLAAFSTSEGYADVRVRAGLAKK